MSVFKKDFHSSEKENIDAGAVAAARIEFTRRLVFTCFALILACLAVFAYISKAWFASNKDVAAENASVTSETGTANLFIRLQGEAATNYYTTLSTNWAVVNNTPLYPISTADCKNWFYIDQRTANSVTTDGITATNYYASHYAKAESISADGLYNESVNQQRRAYYCSSYNLYTDKDTLDVYFNPTNPITITGDEGLKQAIRVGIVVNPGESQSVLIYAPVAESGTGMNFIDASGTKAASDTFYAVTGNQTAAVQTVLVGTTGGNSLEPYIGVAVQDDPYSFTEGAQTICKADTAGTNISVYVWLEGMDAQGVSYIAGSGSINVKLNFVGVPAANS
ncbi:MAG: hypothetical protein PUB32_00895 [Clostridiales bacterium]|nr:hypothetical protein [Clostridiales bacterium]